MEKKRKKKGERPDGLIQVSLSIGRKSDGSLNRKYFYGHTRAEAEERRNEYKSMVSKGQTSFAISMTLSEWIDAYLTTYRTNVNPHYHASDNVPYNRLKKALGNRLINSISESELQRELNTLQGMSFSTVDKYRQAIQRVFHKATKNRLIPYDPADELVMPTFTKGTHRALTQDEINCIIQNWQLHYTGIWMMLLLFTGLRRGEMMALEWDCIDMEHRTIAVQQVTVIDSNESIIEKRAKTAAGIRIIPIAEPLYKVLDSVPVRERVGFVCLSAHRRQLTQSATKRGLQGFLKATGLSFRYHDLRHTFATLLYDAGVDVKAAMYFLGHADIKMTMQLYTHLSKEREFKSGAALQSYLGEITTLLPHK